MDLHSKWEKTIGEKNSGKGRKSRVADVIYPGHLF